MFFLLFLILNIIFFNKNSYDGGIYHLIIVVRIFVFNY